MDSRTENRAAGTAEMPISRDALFATLPTEWPTDPLPELQAMIRARGETVVVLDDDPTGTQTVHDIPVLTAWSPDEVRAELARRPRALYLLTNSRSVPAAEAEALNRETGALLVTAARRAGCRFVVTSRSDSTLRGHFPGEVAALAEGLGWTDYVTLLIPAFIAGGRYTVSDIHYVSDGDRLVPAGQTAFARDAVFGYTASNLRFWVEEKSGGRIPASAVASLSLDTIRGQGPQGVCALLSALPPGNVCVANAASERDLAVVTQGIIDAEARGQRFVYRTAASFVPLRAGIPPRRLLSRPDLVLPGEGGGLVVAGSYVPATSAQLAALLAEPGIVGIEVDVDRLLAEQERQDEIERVAAQADATLRRGAETVVYTSRRLARGSDAAAFLAIGRRISSGLVAIVRGITVRPRYLLAKGGITSHDIATAGLGIRRATVLGQLVPGVPVWQAGPESRYPGLAYIVFPGNVGGPRTLADVVALLAEKRRT